MTQSRRVYLNVLCLVAYLWSATCLGETLLVREFAAHDPHAPVSFFDPQEKSLIFHHAGHRDHHEPNAVDSHSSADESEHGDHAVKLGCAEPGTVSSVKSIQTSKPPTSPQPAAMPLPVVVYAAAVHIPLNAEQPPPSSRNTSLAIVKLTRLRI